MEHPPVDLWGAKAALQSLPGGHRNIVLRSIGSEGSIVFKSTNRSREAVEWLTKVHDIARASGLVVPQLLRSTNGHLVEGGWTCEAFIFGEPFDSFELPTITTELARFHKLACNIPQRPDFLSSQDILELDIGGDVDLTAMPASLVETCRSAWRSVSGASCSVVHGDLNSRNLIRCADGRAALIDWDECRRDLILFDTGQLGQTSLAEKRALLAWEVACSWQIEPDHARKVAQQLFRPPFALAGSCLPFLP